MVSLPCHSVHKGHSHDANEGSLPARPVPPERPRRVARDTADDEQSTIRHNVAYPDVNARKNMLGIDEYP